MTKFKDRIIMGAVFVTLGLIGMFMSAHQVTAAPPATAGPNVTVVNAPDAPIPITASKPLPVSGSMGINGPVKVEQSGAWTVTTDDPYAPGRAATRIGPVQTDFFPARSIPIDVPLLR